MWNDVVYVVLPKWAAEMLDVADLVILKYLDWCEN